jgi:hypothetical protein
VTTRSGEARSRSKPLPPKQQEIQLPSTVPSAMTRYGRTAFAASPAGLSHQFDPAPSARCRDQSSQSLAADIVRRTRPATMPGQSGQRGNSRRDGALRRDPRARRPPCSCPCGACLNIPMAARARPADRAIWIMTQVDGAAGFSVGRQRRLHARRDRVMRRGSPGTIAQLAGGLSACCWRGAGFGLGPA